MQNPAHAFAAAGNYMVTLTVDDGLCASSTASEITVELSTGIADGASTVHRAWATVQGIVVVHGFTAPEAVELELMDATGRVHVQQRMTADRTVIPSQVLSTGIWFVRLTQGGDQVTLRVPLIH